VDVVVRPEDIYFTNDPARTQFTAKVKSCTFKGVHYEMYVDSDTGNELMIQDYDPYPVDSIVNLYVEPDDIQVMKKARVANVLEAKVVGEGKVEMLGGEFECSTEGFEEGDEVLATVAFDKVELLDDLEEGVLDGDVHFILYKGDHYHLTILTDDGDHLWVDTDDIWDKGDLVGIDILPSDIKIKRKNG
jgi:spermidine/putrescine transport system ATP-binding protein